jgi:hypothetical protein
MTFDGKWMFVGGKETEPYTTASEVFGRARMNAKLREWLATQKTSKPNLIMISEFDSYPDSDWEIEFKTIRESYAKLIRQNFGDRLRLFEDDNPELAVKNVKAQRKIKSGKDVAIYWDSVIERAPFVPAMAADFKEADIPLYKTPEVISAGNLILISGHKASSYRNYLSELASKGVLRGKSVALLSCAEEGDREFCRYLIEAGGATAVFRVNQIIPQAVMPSLLREVCKRVNKLPTEGVYLEEFIREAVVAAQQQKSVSPTLKEGLEVILDHSMQVSQLFKNDYE